MNRHHHRLGWNLSDVSHSAASSRSVKLRSVCFCLHVKYESVNHVWLSLAGSLHAHQTVKHSTVRGRCFYSAASPPSPSPSLLQCFVFHNIDPLMFSWWSALCWSAFSPTADGVLPVISTCSGLRARVFFCNIFYSLQKSEWDVGCTQTGKVDENEG